MFENKTKQIKQMRDLQKQIMEMNKDDYTIGLYNGLEIALSVMENREPVFESCITKEPEIKEVEEQKGRTLTTGVRRINKH